MKILSYKLEERVQIFQQVFIEIENWMEKSQHFELDLKVCEDNVGSLVHLGLKFGKGRI